MFKQIWSQNARFLFQSPSIFNFSFFASFLSWINEVGVRVSCFIIILWGCLLFTLFAICEESLPNFVIHAGKVWRCRRLALLLKILIENLKFFPTILIKVNRVVLVVKLLQRFKSISLPLMIYISSSSLHQSLPTSSSIQLIAWQFCMVDWPKRGRNCDTVLSLAHKSTRQNDVSIVMTPAWLPKTAFAIFLTPMWSLLLLLLIVGILLYGFFLFFRRI